jgi:hypothetical protein
VSYTREVQPLLAASCGACHGPDTAARKAGLRLDKRGAALKSAVVPGNASASPLIRRATCPDAASRMPPPGDSRRPLTDAQVGLLRRWINEGALYDDHWAFAPPVRPAVPEVRNRPWVRNPVDAFVAAGHEKRGLRPAPEADRRTLLRRLCYDVTGLPPKPEEVRRFVSDPPGAYEEQVDRLLSSEHFGERMAVLWLDLVRYADTEGYSNDATRSVWPYRDWVINAFNTNMRFDSFTIRQLAGDLVPEPTGEDRIASGYNRLLMTSNEGCASEEGRRAQYQADRVRNVSSVWLGLTLGCAECHDHKFDPLTARHFYRLATFFADVRETAVGEQKPTPIRYAPLEPVQGWNDTLRRRLEEKLLGLPGLEETLKRLEARAGEGGTGDGMPAEVRAALQTPAADRTPHQVRLVLAHFEPDLPGLRPVLTAVRLTEATRQFFLDSFTQAPTLVTESGPRRVVRVLRRGDYLDRSGEVVSPGLPEFLAPGYALGPDATRLDLAKWLASRDNPLAARVFVNRLWRVAFGRGLVDSAEDFGTRGSPPTHPELLDWLAAEFVDSGWDVKHTLRLILSSSAYRQASLVDAGRREKDPGNRALTRQNSFRLEAEFIRDGALAVSGLLADRVGGPSVRPYQPEGYVVGKDYKPSRGEDQYRRGVYTFWCRNYLHPSLEVFDAPPRRSCTADRGRSATPLQSLLLLNDPTYAEAARALAARLIREAPPEGRLAHAFQLALARDPNPQEARILGALFEKHLGEYRRDGVAAAAVVSVGFSPAPAAVDPAELAAWTSVARALLNLHEFVTRY